MMKKIKTVMALFTLSVLCIGNLYGQATTTVNSVYIFNNKIYNTNSLIASNGILYSGGNLVSTNDVTPVLIGGTLYSTGSIVRAIGDSFVTGTGASTYSNSFVSIIAQNTGWSITNLGVGGTALSSFNDAATAYIINDSTRAIALIGFNDLNTIVLGGPTCRWTYANQFRSFIAENIILESNRTYGQSNIITKTGDWGDYNLFSGGVKTIGSGVAGSTATFVFTGRSLYLGYTCRYGLGDAGVFSLSIDGTTNVVRDTAIAKPLYESPGYWPEAMRIAGLYDGLHTGKVTVVSGFIHLNWFATNRKISNNGPILYLGSTPRRTALNGGNINNLEMINSINKQVASEFFLDGFNVAYVDVNTFFDPELGDITGAEIHPNDQGHMHIAKAFLNICNSLSTPSGRYVGQRDLGAYTTFHSFGGIDKLPSTNAISMSSVFEKEGMLINIKAKTESGTAIFDVARQNFESPTMNYTVVYTGVVASAVATNISLTIPIMANECLVTIITNLDGVVNWWYSLGYTQQ